MDADSGAPLAETLVARRETVTVLAEQDGVTVRGLQETIDVSRATAHRVLTALVEHSVVTNVDGEYTLTPFGRVIASELETYMARVRAATAIRPLLDSFEDAPVRFDLDWVVGATISRATTTDPYGPVQRFDELAAEASTERVLNDGLVAPSGIVEGADDRLEGGIDHTMILTGDALELYRDRHPSIVEDSFDRENTTTLVAEEVPLDLTLFDERLVLPLIDPEIGAVSLLVDTDDPDAMAWGESVFEACREDAVPVDEWL